VTNRPNENPAPAAKPSGPLVAFRLNLEQQRKRAKELRRSLLAGDPSAQKRFRAYHPAGTGSEARLSEAQLVIARELGLPSWPKLKAHIEAMEHARDSISGEDKVLDAEFRTLHIRCGSDIESTLNEGGFVGEFLEYSDPLCQGPVVDCPDWTRLRAEFLARSYGTWLTRQAEEIAAGLEQAEENLRSASERYERVVLWLEHDTYDQLILARCLAQFAERPPRRLELISVDHFPGGMRFIGLGQLPPEALRLLWKKRREVSARQLSFGRSVWNALRAPDPSALVALTHDGAPALPHLAVAVRRPCQELPWTSNGLALTQRLILQMLAEEPHRIGRLFHDLMLEREPLPWQSDLLFRDIVEAMKQVSKPVFTGLIDKPEQPWWRERLTITPLGRAVLAGDVDWMSLRPPERWVGGVVIRPDQPCWRWNPTVDRAVSLGA
jgi:hypothetical protein